MLLIKPLQTAKPGALFEEQLQDKNKGVVAEQRGREADFSTPQLAKSASCSGRNDGCSIWKRKTKAKALW
jgi:hypothetical protein